MSVRINAIAIVLAAATAGGFTAARADSVFVGGEMGWVDRPVQSTLSAEAVRAEAIRSHRDGTMTHAEYAPKSEQFRSTRSREDVRAEAIRSHKDGSMLHSEVTPLTASGK